MREDKVRRLDLSDSFLLESAERRFQEGDYFGALTMLNKRAEKFEPSADAWALYADVYEAMELYPQAVDAWFRFLDTCNEADFGEGYEGLAVAFMNMGDEVQSAIYYRRAMQKDDMPEDIFETELKDIRGPQMKVVHSEDGFYAGEQLSEGLALLKAGELDEAKERFEHVPEGSAEYPTAIGLAATCTLMMGDEEGAEKLCTQALSRFPDNVQALTAYCAVLGAQKRTEEAEAAARHLAELPVDSTEDLYRIATALCETKLDGPAYEKLCILKKRIPNDETMLFFHAVAAYRLEKLDEAIDSLERLTTICPRKSVAQYYLERMRELRSGEGEAFKMGYYYRLPREEYKTVARFLLTLVDATEEDVSALGELKELNRFLRLAADEMEGRDDKMLLLALRVAIVTRSDAFLREMLLDYNGNEFIKLTALHLLAERNEDNSFGVVLCNLYKEYFTHHIEIGERKQREFLQAYADAYAKCAMLSEENEEKICAAAEDVYATLAEANVWDYFDDPGSIAAVICRESRIDVGVKTIEEISDIFDGNVATVKKVLEYMM